MKAVLRVAALTFVVLFGMAASVPAQTERGAISGQITDNTGATLPGTMVTLTNEETGVKQTATANGDGNYQFQNLNPGRYTVSVTREGFKKSERVHTVVDVNQTNEQNVKLDVGANTEVVEVTTGVQQLQTESASTGLIVEEQSIKELPLVYGNPFTLETLAPGVLPSGVNPNIHTYDSGTANVSINGSVLNALEYRLDGAPDNRIRLSAYTPSTEFINQYKVETSTYDATEGHSAGGFVNVSLKSGTNQFHGSAFGYYQNPSLNANYWHLGTTPSAKSLWLREGGAVGGPVLRDRAFFFAGLEHSRSATPNVLTQTVPTVAMRSGDFSALHTNGFDCNNAKGTAAQLQGCIYDPATGVAATVGGKVTRTAFPGNVIPLNRQSPIAQKALTYYPLPNTTVADVTGAGNYNYSLAEPDYYYAYVTRGDVTLSKRQQIYGHYVQSRRFQKGKNAYFAPVSGTNLTYNNKGAALGYIFTISPSTILEAHATWTRFVNQNTVPSQGLLDATSIGMPSYLVNGLGDNARAFPRLDITGYTSLNSDNGVLSHDDVSLGSVQVSHLTGNHFLRTGVEFRMYNTNAGVTTQSNGRYQHTGVYTEMTSGGSASAYNSVAQFLLGLPNSSAITVNSDLAVRSDYWAGWLNDDWKPTPKLTLNLGLRYEYEGPNSERNQKANTYFDFGATNPINAAVQANYAKIATTNALLPAASAFAVNGGLRFLTDSGSNRQDYNAQSAILLPRVGISYQFLPNTVVRAGIGLFADSLSTFYLSGGNSGSTSTFLLPQQGFTQTTSVSGSSDSLAFTSTLANPFPNGITLPQGNSLGLQTYLGQSVTFQPPNPNAPYNERWSFGLQRQFGGWLAAVDYVGNHGLHLPINRDFDAVPRQYLSTATNGFDVDANTRLTATVTNPFRNIIPTTVSLGSGSTVAVQQLLRPYPEFTGVSGYITGGSSIYHSFQAQLNRRFVGGASLTTAFTWSKSLDSTAYLNASDAQPWYGVSANDRTFRFSTSGIYQLPFGTGRRFLNSNAFVSAIVGGWQVQGVYQVQSGAPLSFNPGSTSPVYTQGNPVNAAWGRDAYKRTASPGIAGTWFNTAGFLKTTTTSQTAGVDTTVVPGAYQIRTFPIRFDGLRADFLNQADLGVQRNFSLSKLYEPLQLQVRAELTNLFNHPVYNSPSTDYTSVGTFGTITSQANAPRIYQFVGFIRF